MGIKWIVFEVHKNSPDALFSRLLEESCKDEKDIHTSTGNCFLIVLAKYDSCYTAKNMKPYTFQRFWPSVYLLKQVQN